jgi:TrmH family RNA methyltransferase
MDAGVVLNQAFMIDNGSLTAPFMNRLAASSAELLWVAPEVFAKLSYGERNEGIVVVAETPRRNLDDLRLPAIPLVAVLEGIEKPGNIGAILRTADAAGVDAVVVADCRTDLYHSNTIRSSLGTVFRHNVVCAATADVQAWLAGNQISTYATRPDAKTDFYDLDMTASVALVLGSEAHGLADAWDTSSVTAVRLPMLGLGDSLNVSATAAALFYEALRQRQLKSKSRVTSDLSFQNSGFAFRMLTTES